MIASTFMALALAAAQQPHPFPGDAALALVAHDAKDFRGHVVCISIDDADPPPPLMAAIKKSLPLAAPASACTGPEQYVVHKPTGKHAAIISMSDFRKTSSSTATAEYSVNAGPLAGNWYTAKFRLVNGAWRLVGVDMYMAS